MKKLTIYSMTALMLGIGTLSTGCFGSFTLVRKVYDWNDSLGNNFVKTIVFYALNIIPVYGIAGAVDLYILNLVEFWTGSNPMAMKDGQAEKQIVLGKDGNRYEITATKNRFDVVQLTGANKGVEQSMIFKPEQGVCSVVMNGVESKLVAINESTNMVEFFRPDGSSFSVNANTDIAVVKDLYESSYVVASK